MATSTGTVYENFQLYTEFDEGSDITVDSAVKVSWVNLQNRNQTGYVYKDYGASHFNGDFIHQFECQYANVGTAANEVFWLLSNDGDGEDRAAHSSNSRTAVNFDYAQGSTSFLLGLAEADGNWSPSDAWAGSAASTLYYVTITKDHDGGGNSTGQYVAVIRTGSHVGAVSDTLTVDQSAGKQTPYRYVYVCSTYDDNANAFTSDGFTQNLNLSP